MRTIPFAAATAAPTLAHAQSAGVTWDATTIAEYGAKPKELIPGDKMAFAGLKKQDEIADLIAHITANCCS